ncbi:outer membrane protein assembly factor BamA [Labrys wisconsinensis]|uniref:Outer membrane protein assembly factor BamA n=1 Tax=Labrys wisconsinensis TaxID=425677 RepID=A0ABU0J7Z0_9HYPH|nr:outer membrane protein assembly factor BamA [Labrys wisconsinensis]MDQ0469307.1 outer membrane protein insertion porin family [Labrys wisconsinensis]
MALVLVALCFAFGAAPVVFAAVAQAQAAPAAPIINRVVFEKNKKINSDTLQSGMESKPKTPFDPKKVETDIARMKDYYAANGRATVVITYRTVSLPNNRVDLILTVNEGEKIGVEEIRFIGNNAYSDWRLKRQMATVESGYFGWLRTTDTYDPNRIAGDVERLTRFYANRGYPDFRVVSVVPTLNEKQDAYIITFTVDEGQYHTFGAATVQSTVPEINSADLESKMRTSTGDAYDAEDVDKTVEDMTDELARSGHPFAQVRPRGERDANGNINIAYVVEEGAKVYIERINISGNTRTRDYVIRREFDVAEGDPYNKAMIDRAARRLRNLGYFESVKITNEPGSAPDRVIIDVEVVDQSTGEFSVGGGYSTSDGFIGEVSLSERNFLGRGQYVKVAVQYGQNTQGVQFSFTEPYFLGQRIAAGFDLFTKKTDQSDYTYYNNRVTGGTLRATFPVTEDFSFGVRYSGYQQQVSIPSQYDDCGFPPNMIPYDPKNPNACWTNGEASLAIKDLVGTRFVSTVGYTLAYSTLDDIKNPSEGTFVSFKQDFAGVGGDAKWLKSTVDARYYYPITDDLTLMVRGQGGYMVGWGGDKLAIVDQFNLGPDLVRGFAPGGIGPRDISGAGGNTEGNSLGGTTYYGGTVELQFPLLGLPRELGLRGALFADAGTLYNYGGKNYGPCSSEQFCLLDESTIRSSVGASLLWASPLGPLRFDFSQVLSKARGDQTQFFHFSGGTTF